MDGIGGCPNVGGICIGCTMPGFPDKFMPFMDEPPGARLQPDQAFMGALFGRCAALLNRTVNKEPKWRHPGAELTTGYRPSSRVLASFSFLHHMATITDPVVSQPDVRSGGLSK